MVYLFDNMVTNTLIIDINEKKMVLVCVKNKKTSNFRGLFILWSHLGSNQGPPDYESGALTN